jgi:hypothetical protein
MLEAHLFDVNDKQQQIIVNYNNIENLVELRVTFCQERIQKYSQTSESPVI